MLAGQVLLPPRATPGYKEPYRLYAVQVPACFSVPAVLPPGASSVQS
jgi:hypothetical protein